MSDQSVFVAAIIAAGTALGSRVYAANFDGQPATPYAIVTRIDAVPETCLQGSGVTRNRWQVDVFGPVLDDLITIQKALIVALESPPLRAITLQISDFYEGDVKLYRTSIDWAAWQ
jgi:hypothetical protein